MLEPWRRNNMASVFELSKLSYRALYGCVRFFSLQLIVGLGSATQMSPIGTLEFA